MEYPPADLNNVVSFLVSVETLTTVPKGVAAPEVRRAESEAPSVLFSEPLAQEMKSCPKCGALNGRRSKECYSCHVLFERLEGLPTDPSLRAQPSLVRKWKNLMENFGDEKLHEEFLRSCHELDALKFAAFKYEDLKTAQGGDSQCDQMLARIQSLMLVSLSQKSKTKSAANTNEALIPAKWRKYLFWGPYSLAALFILLGMANLGHRNLIGVGVALICMTSGLIVMIKGRISVSDFID